MAEILIFNKFFYFSVIMGLFPIIAQMTASDKPLGLLASSIVVILMIIIMLPQLLLVFKPYRKELLSGIQDADGKTNRDDLRYFASWVMPFTSLQTLVFISLFSLVAERELPNVLIWSLVAVTTGTALPPIANLIKGSKGSKDS